jgi:MraZ protein
MAEAGIMGQRLLGTFRGVQLSTEGLIVPPLFRTGLEQGFVMTRGLDRCVAVFPLPVWQALLDRIELSTLFLRGAARLFHRYIYGGASVHNLGSEDLMSVPEHLRIYAELGDEVVLVGVAGRLEIWNADRWDEEESRMEQRAEQISEALSQYGI